MQHELYELTGIHFDIEQVDREVSTETLGGDTPDTIKAYSRQEAINEFYANAFSFNYRGARISGRLPRVYAGFSSALDAETVDLMPAVYAACGFKFNTAEVE